MTKRQKEAFTGNIENWDLVYVRKKVENAHQEYCHSQTTHPPHESKKKNEIERKDGIYFLILYKYILKYLNRHVSDTQKMCLYLNMLY